MANKPVYLNITEIRGMPMIIINAYEGLAFIIGLVFVKWISFALKQICKRQGEGLAETPVARAVPTMGRPRPLRRLGEWLDDITTPTSQRSSVFSDVETKDDDSEMGNPTAAEIRPEETTEGADATRANAGLVSYG
tara:strand:- start:2494 stop:2901 length:408 start_codon:yes stop_codon:yes gene_type:complete